MSDEWLSGASGDLVVGHPEQPVARPRPIASRWTVVVAFLCGVIVALGLDARDRTPQASAPFVFVPPMPPAIAPATPPTAAPTQRTSTTPPTPQARSRTRVPARADVTSTLVEIELASAPSGATVTIDGAVWGMTPLTMQLPGGRAVVAQFTHAGHEPTTITVDPARGRLFKATLQPAQRSP